MAKSRPRHALLDGLAEIVEKNDLQPREIDGIKVWVEGFVEQPVWLNRKIEHVHDAQFSIALGAHRVRPGKAWQDPALVLSPSVMQLMDKVTHEVHPDDVQLLTGHAAIRPARLEVRARQDLRGRKPLSERQPLARPDQHIDHQRTGGQVPPQR